MQLPRGTFRYIKKNTKLGGILDELMLMKFTGICTISSASSQGSLVFKSGKRILAEFRDITGDPAWDEFQKITGENVDASVSSMDDTQIELSLEFNKPCCLGKGGKSEQTQHSSVKMETVQTERKSPITSHLAKSIQRPRIPDMPVLRPSITFETLRSPDQIKTPGARISQQPVQNPAMAVIQPSQEILPDVAEKKKSEEETRNTTDAESKNFESDIDVIETMDVDIITSKIRGECKTLIKELRLDHLTEH